MSNDNINRNMALFLNGAARGNASQARQALARLNATGGANNRRYPRGSTWFGIHSNYMRWLDAIRRGQPVNSNSSLTRYIVSTIPGQLHLNQPTIGWNRYVPGLTPIMRNLPSGASANNINSIYRRFLNAIRNGNGAAQARAWRELNATSGANNRRYPTLLRFLTDPAHTNRTAWVTRSRAGNARGVPGQQLSNLIRQQLSINQPGVWGAAPRNSENTIASFNRAPRTRNTFNRYAQQWFGVNTREQRVEFLLRNLNVRRVNGGNGETKRRKLEELFWQLPGASRRGSANRGSGSGSGGSASQYTLANFNSAPRTRNTFNTYAREWFGKNFRGQNLSPRIALHFHPNKGNRNPNSNDFKKRDALMKLYSHLRGR